ncbi:hypothetical protein IAU60_001214 [Kwoniella sp. DSM 27419]
MHSSRYYTQEPRLVDHGLTSPQHSPGSSHTSRQDDEASGEEIRTFFGEWRGFCYFYSAGPTLAASANDHILQIGMLDTQCAGACFWCAAQYATIVSKDGSGEEVDRWNRRKDRFYRAALTLVKDDSSPFISRMGALLDMRLGLLGDSIIQSNMGSRPLLPSASTETFDALATQAWAFANVLHTITHKGVRTLFIIDAATTTNTVVEPALQVHLGLPFELMCLFARVSNLSCLDGQMDRQAQVEEGQDISREIDSWKPDIRAEMSSVAITEAIATAMLWRETIFQLGALAASQRHSLAQFLQIAASIKGGEVPGQSLFNNVARACPWFIASTLAVSPDDRARCIEGLTSCGPFKLFLNNLAAVQQLWALMDETGHSPDWREVLRSRKITVSFL